MLKKIILTMFISFGFYGLSNASFVYPIQEMSKLECRFEDFGNLSSSCKTKLPILKSKDYKKYAKQNGGYNEYTRIYTVLWGATYEYGWDIGNGGHAGIDIATSKGTPVHNITDGTVVLARELKGWGKTVSIKHRVNGRDIHSNYSHLDKILVKQGQKVKTSQIIGEVGSSGNSTGNHLHFQIDVNGGFHPFYYDANKCPYSYSYIVSSGKCFECLQENTVDPIVFLESNGAVMKSYFKDMISKDSILTREEIEAREIKEFLKYHKLELKYKSIGGNIPVGGVGYMNLNVKKINGNNFNGTLPGGGLTFEKDDSKLKFLPEKLLLIQRGGRDIQIKGLKEGKIKIKAMLGKHIIKTFYINVYNSKKTIYPSSGFIFSNTTAVIGDLKTGAVILKDKNNTKLINLKYGGNFKLKSSDNNVLFCLKKGSIKTLNYQLNTGCTNYTNEINFNYNDTLMGVLFYKYKILGKGTARLELINTYNDKKFVVKKIKIKEPKELTNKYKYYNDILLTLENNISTIYRKGYFSENKGLTFLEANTWIKNSLNYYKTKSNNSDFISVLNSKLNDLSKENKSKYTNISRVELLELAGKYLIFKDLNQVNSKNSYRDLDSNQNKILNAFYDDENFWQSDRFPKYFKAKEIVSRGEASYLLNSILKL